MSSCSTACRWAFSLALLTAGLPVLAHERLAGARSNLGRALDARQPHEHGLPSTERDRRRMDALERQRRIDAYEASQGGRSRPGAPGDQPYNNPRPPDTPMPLLQRNPYRK